MASKIIFAPTNADEITDLARSMTPPGFELVVVEVGTPKFYDQAADAEYYLGLSVPIEILASVVLVKNYAKTGRSEYHVSATAVDGRRAPAAVDCPVARRAQ